MRQIIIVTASMLALLVTLFGVYRALHSPLFVVRVVEVADQFYSDATHAPPIDEQEIIALANVPVGQISLIDLDLKIIEQKILKHPWIREVRLQKRFPQTLSISVVYREAKALYQNSDGELSYVDQDGKIFGHVSLLFQPDLPIFSTIPEMKIPEALHVLNEWEKTSNRTQVSSLSWDEDRGYRILVTYSKFRTIVDLGQNIDTEFVPQLGRLDGVFDYLSQHQIAAHQIYADAGKKIVVKTAHGS